MDYTLLRNINALSHQWTVKIRVTRISKFISPQDPSKILRVNFVMLDEESTSMDAEIQQEWVPKFMPRLQEGSVYYVKYFRVSDSRYSYNAVNRSIMARFTKYTVINEVAPVPAQFPLYAYDLVPFEQLRERAGINTVCTDILGLLAGCTHVMMQPTKGGPKPLRSVYLSNGSDTVPIALWGDHAEQFPADSYIQADNENPTVLLFVGLTCRMYKGNLTLQGSSICAWYANPNIPQADALCETYIALNGKVPVPVWYDSAVPAPAPEKISVAELSTVTNPHTIANNKYVIDVKIKCLKPGQPWWYHACAMCTKTAVPEGHAYRCTARSCTSTKGGPRYRLAVLAIDPAEPLHADNVPVIELVFFGSKAEELIGIPAEALITSQPGVGSFLPKQLTGLYGREYQLRISLSPSSLEREQISYQVSVILGAPTRITVNAKDNSSSTVAATMTHVATPSETDHTSTESSKGVPSLDVVPALEPTAPSATLLPAQVTAAVPLIPPASPAKQATSAPQQTALPSDWLSSTPPPPHVASATSQQPPSRKRSSDILETTSIDSIDGSKSKLDRDKSRSMKRLKFDDPANSQ